MIFKSYAKYLSYRFILSLASCNRCLVVDDQLNILPVSSHSFEIKLVTPTQTNEELKELKSNMQDTQPVGSLLNCCCTLDQVLKKKKSHFIIHL